MNMVMVTCSNYVKLRISRDIGELRGAADCIDASISNLTCVSLPLGPVAIVHMHCIVYSYILNTRPV